MSSGQQVAWSEAYEVAREVSDLIAPHCKRSKVVGSLRRRRPLVRDIEIVIEPRQTPSLGLTDPEPDIESVHTALRSLGEVGKCGQRFVQVHGVLGSGLTLDAFMIHPPAEWGSIVAIRTGPYELGIAAMTRLKRRGTPHRQGRIVGVPTPTEEAFFEAAGLPCLPPHERDALATRTTPEDDE